MNKAYVFTNKKWKKPNAYQIEHLGPDAFLDPKTKKYPIKNKTNGPIYVHALIAAAHYSSQSMWNDTKVHAKANELLKLYKDSKKFIRNQVR
jgi:hypothetical protein